MSTTKAARLPQAARLLMTAAIVGTLLVGGAIALLTPLLATAVSTWTNYAVTAQTGTFTATFDAVPSMNKEDAVMGFSPVQAGDYTDLAAIVRFNNTGTIDARNAGGYSAATAFTYSAGSSYHFRLAVNVVAKTYSVFVTRPGQSEVTLASNYAFRSE